MRSQDMFFNKHFTRNRLISYLADTILTYRYPRITPSKACAGYLRTLELILILIPKDLYHDKGNT